MYKTFRGVAKHKIPSKTYSPLSGAHFQFLLGYFIDQQQETKKREQWAEILFRQAKDFGIALRRSTSR